MLGYWRRGNIKLRPLGWGATHKKVINKPSRNHDSGKDISDSNKVLSEDKARSDCDEEVILFTSFRRLRVARVAQLGKVCPRQWLKYLLVWTWCPRNTWCSATTFSSRPHRLPASNNFHPSGAFAAPHFLFTPLQETRNYSSSFVRQLLVNFRRSMPVFALERLGLPSS